MPDPTCPAEDEFKRFARGELSDAQRAAVAAHVSQCPVCQKVLNQCQETLTMAVLPRVPAAPQANYLEMLTPSRR